MVEKDLRFEGGLWRTETGEVLERVSESNYVFRISEADRQKVRAWAQHEGSVVPAAARNKVLDDLERQNPEISVSRPLERLEWGIKVPGDASQTIYVWLDALTNYLTVLGYPNTDFDESNISRTVHIIGKDITKFHCIYYPSFLLAAKLPLP